MVVLSKPIAAVAVFISFVSAQSFQRLGSCPDLGCIIPPDQADFLAGQRFDIRLEVHAPVNGSEATGNPNPDENFSFTIERVGGHRGVLSGSKWFKVAEPKLEKWTFGWFEDYFARDAKTPSIVNVASKAYRKVYLDEAGEYKATLTYNGKTTTATWNVRNLEEVRKTRNVLFFIGDGMTTNMITAARLIGHKSKNGKYLSKMAMDTFPVLGHAMTHSIDSFITDSANSATALYTGHKSTVNALGVYVDSSPNVFDDPKVESIAELFYRIYRGHVGIVSTAAVADATPAALTSHTRDRGQAPYCVDSFLHGTPNYTWVDWNGPDVLFGGGAEQFYPPSLGGKTYLGKDYYQEFSNAGYGVYLNKTSLLNAPNTDRALGIFSVSHMSKWLDRNVYKNNLKAQSNHPSGNKGDAEDQPGLKEMTLKAIDILHTRAKADPRHSSQGWFLMSEAASIDKMMHVLDYDRALGELLELDDTIKASIEKLKALGELSNTLIVVTADHGHGFDVMGSVDTKYLVEQPEDRKKRSAVGVYEQSGLSGYQNSGDLTYTDGSHFPSNWTPRYALFAGLATSPDRRENYKLHENGPRLPATNTPGRPSNDYYANDKDSIGGFVVNGTLPTDQAQGVHSLTDVPVFAMGPCQELFGGVQNNIDIFFNMANCLGLSRTAHGKGQDPIGN
ncbi:hypothetical protein H072_11516 [Dactylellina haptotyla CBS 200.50]|uniref:alkaline phosphatase n=1 Tax=Dactylellina haptotyla (strain CBS 200.50) TaxID=1284197 RepID=S8A258_DACHA|nr:hypothetical protein H072_11516 [Dactylellina haptotyla CBS 200.50]